MNGNTAYILSKSLIEKTAQGLGVVKGKNAVVEKVEPIDGGQAITFRWVGDDGTTQRRTISISDGVGVVDIKIEDDHLFFYLTDGTKVDAGELDITNTNIWIGSTMPPEGKGYMLWINPDEPSILDDPATMEDIDDLWKS